MMVDQLKGAPVDRAGGPYLNTAQAAHILGMSPRSLRRLRVKGRGPAYRLHLRAVVYHVDDLHAWSAARRIGDEA